MPDTNVTYGSYMSYTNFSGISLPNYGDHAQTFLKPLFKIGDSTNKATLGTAAIPLMEIYATSALAAGNIVSFQMTQILTGASAVNTIEAARFVVSTEVQIGNWANAILGKIDFGTTGRVTGLAGAICAEMDMPNAAAIPTGHYVCFEAEMNFPTTTTIGGGTKAAFFALNAWGAGVADFDTNGYLFTLDGLTEGDGKLYDNSVSAATGDSGIKILVDGVEKWLLVADDNT